MVETDGGGGFGHELWIHRVNQPALVFGSTQRLPLTDDRAAPGESDPADELEICRRRSGGGLVFVSPGADVWIDAIVPVWSELHHDDVGQAFVWLGHVWLEALTKALQPIAPHPPEARVPSSPSLARRLRMAEPQRSPHRSRRAFFCFADVGHGELLLDGRKVVGMSQRRTRQWTRLQTLFLPRWNADVVNNLLRQALSPFPDQARTLGDPPYDASLVAAGLPETIDIRPDIDIVDTFIEHLPSVSSESDHSTADRPDGRC